jgi:two-component system NtrC family sensor kinase
MGSERIATTLDEQLWGSHAAAEVVQKVLGKGEPYIGIAKVVKENFYTAYSPISDFSGRRLGILGIGIEEKVYAEVKSQTLTLFSSLIAGGMIFGFIMSFWFAAWLVRPVRQLAEAIDKVAQGDLSYKVSISSADELGRLARSFNMMVRAVKERDLKLREITEERLSMVEKQVSIGRLAAGVAHEINNPLTSILSLSSLMLKHTPNEDEKKEDLKIIVAETTRCRDIVRSLLDFARERPMKKQPVEINQIVKDTLALTTKYESMDRASVHAELSEKTLLVNADPKQLQQVFTNIIINAAEALDKDGTITISTDEDTTGGFVILKVKDSGKGIPKEHIKRIFEPFFTTKGTGKGTGLGLSVSFGIIQKHEGAIEIESEEGKGTTVIITLPRWNANA